MSDADALNRRLVDDLTDTGALPERWRPAFLAAPRHLFVPDVIWQASDGGGLTAHHRDDDPQAWLEAAYGDRPITTQVDDGITRPGQTGRMSTSSISKPTIVAGMLDHLDVEPGMRVLEIGTGTGWNAALLAHMAGAADNVVTVEVDGGVADRARKALAEAGVEPLVATGDGGGGWPAGGPYDRVICTAAVRAVPYAWVAQTRSGGVILTPWGTAYDNGALARLTVGDDGRADGRFVDNTIAFMWLRAQRTPHPDIPADTSGAVESATVLHPDAVAFNDFDAMFAIGLRLPDVVTKFVDADDGDDFTFWAFSGASWARVDVVDGIDTHHVRQHGPRRLWDEVEAAYEWWHQAGRPETGRFGLAVASEGEFVFLDTPSNPVT